MGDVWRKSSSTLDTFDLATDVTFENVQAGLARIICFDWPTGGLTSLIYYSAQSGHDSRVGTASRNDGHSIPTRQA